ncbi:MAG: hypothetical protein QOH66_736 [Actinomycetota bacterium]|nr:hypothetical protein [Actinomycetota bacterium]
MSRSAVLRRTPALQRAADLPKGYPYDAGFLMGAAVAGLLFVFVAQGGFPLGSRSVGRLHFYTVQAVAVLHGHLDVPQQALNAECFMIHRTKCMGYFGITPALLRLPVALLLRSNGKFPNYLEAVYFLLGFVVTALGAWWVSRQLVVLWAPTMGGRRLKAIGFVGAVSCLAATPLLYLVARPLVYEEAILWAVAFSGVALGAVVSMWRRPRPATLVVLLLADLLAVSARPTVGASALFATVVLGWRLLARSRAQTRSPGEPSRRLAVWGASLMVGAVVAFASAPAVLYLKFGTFSPPYRASIAMFADPAKLAAVAHPGGTNPVVLPTKALSVLRPDSLQVLGHPPYVVLGESQPTLLWPAKPADVLHMWEPTSSLTATMPFSAAVALVAIVGLVGTARRRAAAGPGTVALNVTAVLVVSALGAMVTELVFPGQTYRYLADWLPLLFVLVPIGLVFLGRRVPSTPWPRRFLIGAGCLVLAAQGFIQMGLAVENGLVNGGEQPAACPGPPNPYGPLGVLFCPKTL